MRINVHTVAELLGHEMRFADECEKPGLECAVGTVRAHLRHTRPEAFDADAFDAAYERAIEHGAFTADPEVQPRRRPDLPPKPVGPLTEPTRYDRILMALVQRGRATLKKRERARIAAYNAANGLAPRK
jgi:hypothetical protein